MAAAKKPVKAKAKPPAPRKALTKAPPAKPARKPVPRPAPEAAATTTLPVSSEKSKKPKLVRDSFTIPKPEYAVLAELKERSARQGMPAKKSEVLRAGIKVLAAMGDAAFVAALRAVPALKTGRPAKG